MIEDGIRDVGSLSGRELWLIGIALYWAEGTKQKDHNVSQAVIFGNTDYRMISVYLRWLYSLNISIDELVFELYVHEIRLSEAQDFIQWWSEKLSISLDNCVVYKKKGNPKTNRRNVKDLYHGLLRIKVRTSTTLNRIIDGWISGIASNQENWGIV